MTDKTIKIGGACGYWGDSSMATPQLLATNELDFIVYDYLAEITMSIMARSRARNPEQGFAGDFVYGVMKENLVEIARQKVRIVSNAGGVNPEACGAALTAIISDLGLNLKVAVITGDDLFNRKDELATISPTEMFTGDTLPPIENLASINAYLGAFPIAAALNAGADIVITGRCVDSAVTLGACIHHFGWAENDWQRLSAGTLAGHILECGSQATGGNFTDWREVAGSIAEIGYPIAEIDNNGDCIISKPEGTGGLVSVGTISEQMLYEIGDPQAYIVPDVICDFSTVKISQYGPDLVHLTGASGYPAPAQYKVCATYADGFRGGLLMTFYGREAEDKAIVFCNAAYERARKTLRSRNLADFSETSVEVLGAESQYGNARQIVAPREVVVKLAAKHPEADGIAILLKEATGTVLASPPGGSGFQAGRPRPSPVIRLFNFLHPRDDIPIAIKLDGQNIDYRTSTGNVASELIVRPDEPIISQTQGPFTTVPLEELAWGRSGDKGDKANIGIIARKPEYLPYIWAALSEEVIASQFSHFLEGSVEKFLLPASNAINFLLHDVLGGGGIASLRNDAQAKGYAQLLLDYPIEIPTSLLKDN